MLLRQREQEILSAMKGTADGKSAIEKLRFWQAFSQFVDILESDPLSIKKHLESARIANGEDPDLLDADPIFVFSRKSRVPADTIVSEG
jgi:hypothetical protein